MASQRREIHLVGYLVLNEFLDATVVLVIAGKRLPPRSG
jgi:hypothetical protein